MESVETRKAGLSIMVCRMVRHAGNDGTRRKGETMTTATKLENGKQYDVTALVFAGWTGGDGSGHDGYNWRDYFGPDGRYLGPDQHGIEPLFAV